MGDNRTNRFTAHSTSFGEAQGDLTRTRDCNREQKERKKPAVYSKAGGITNRSRG